ncbi:MAG: SLC13 family permease [Vulcanibacillus sp.]
MLIIIRDKLSEEIIFIVSLILAFLTSLFVKPSWYVIDFRVILPLFNLMIISLAFAKYRLLEYIAMYLMSHAKTKRSIGLIMILTSALLGMLITNDVALLTIVPITISIARQAEFNPYKIIALETVAANIGSSLTPFGNPQNLYLYTFYHIDTFYFLKTLFPLVLFGIICLVIINLSNSKEILKISDNKISIENKKRVLLYTLLFILVLLSVLRFLDYLVITLLVVVVILIMDRSLFLKVDYFLLGTFACFFIFVDNITQLEFVNSFIGALLDKPITVYEVSVILSQGISNVPTAVLLSGFTNFYEALLLGVSVGGLGTLVASLANLISYKYYAKSYPKKIFLVYFGILNFCLLIILSVFVVFII